MGFCRVQGPERGLYKGYSTEYQGGGGFFDCLQPQLLEFS